MFLNDQKGNFSRAPGALKVLPTDQTSVLAWPQTSGGPAILVASSGYETSKAAAGVFKYPFPTLNPETVIDASAAGSGTLVFGDLSGDGTLALFVGGTVIGGRYPESTASRIFKARDGSCNSMKLTQRFWNVSVW